MKRFGNIGSKVLGRNEAAGAGSGDAPSQQHSQVLAAYGADLEGGPLEGGLGGLEEVPLASEIEPAPEVDDPGRGQKLASTFRKFGRQLSSAGTKLVKRGAGGDRQQDQSPPGGSPQFDAPPPAPGQPFGPPAASGTPERRQRSRPAGSSNEAEADVLVRLGLAAHAVGAYIRCVMHLQITRRTASTGEPGSPGRPQFPVHSRGNSSMTGSRHLEEQQLRELDTVMEARGELDVLAELQSSPLIAARPAAYQAFMQQMPEMLSARTSVATAQGAVARLLLPGASAAQVLSVLGE